jgi:ferredoxin-fold anticodon binding domain-containing protein
MKNENLSNQDWSKVLAKTEDINVIMYHVKSLADLLICKFNELVDGDKLKSDELSDPILSIAEMLKEKAEASLKTIEDIGEMHDGPYDRQQHNQQAQII